MFGPFCARYAREFAWPELFEDLCSQFSNAENAMRDRASGLYFHGWDESRRQLWADPATGLSPHVWGRAVGWLSMALIDTLDYLPADHSCAAKLAAMFRDLIGAVVAGQDASGLWFQVMDCPDKAGNYLEESASAMFAYALFKGMRTGLLDRGGFQGAADRALGVIASRFLSEDDSGKLHVNGICKVAGLGGEPYRDGSFAYYIGEPVVSDDYKGTGAFILALCEALG
jgi:unsaturated rhamnogalacturonyl hydrolase